MQFQWTDDRTLKVAIDEDLSIYQVALLQQQIRQAAESEDWARAAGLSLDLGQVDECDTAGLQWLLALRGWARQQQLDFSVDSLSDAVRDQVDLCRVHSVLGIPALIPAQHQTAHQTRHQAQHEAPQPAPPQEQEHAG